MHADQTEVTVEEVKRLIAQQFPQWRHMDVRPVASHGTENALFRVGDDVALRFPFHPVTGEELLREQDCARRIAANAPVRVPQALGIGEPGEGYPGRWAAYSWITGENVTTETVGEAFVSDVAAFVRAMRAMDTGGAGWDGHSRGGPLACLDAEVRQALKAGTALVDTVALEQAWTQCRDTPRSGTDVWLHADLMPGNLLIHHDRLAAVIDFGTVSIGDPAVDLMPAWNLFDDESRSTFRRKISVDDELWERGRGWAIAQAIVALVYYVDTNPVMADTARHTLAAVLRD